MIFARERCVTAPAPALNCIRVFEINGTFITRVTLFKNPANGDYYNAGSVFSRHVALVKSR